MCTISNGCNTLARRCSSCSDTSTALAPGAPRRSEALLDSVQSQNCATQLWPSPEEPPLNRLCFKPSYVCSRSGGWFEWSTCLNARAAVQKCSKATQTHTIQVAVGSVCWGETVCGQRASGVAPDLKASHHRPTGQARVRRACIDRALLIIWTSLSTDRIQMHQ